MPMQTPEQLRRRLQSHWQNRRRHWLLGQGQWPLPLGTEPPTEAEASADRQRFEYFGSWLTQWRKLSHVTAGVVHYETRSWPSLGPQELPCAWRFATPQAVAAELGHAVRWERAKRRFDAVAAWKEDPGWHDELSRHFDLLADMDDAEFERLCGVAEWLRQRPQSGFYPRQLPIPGIDSKWVERNKRVLASWVKALMGAEASGDFYQITGLRKPSDRLRLWLLDRSARTWLGGLTEVEAPVQDIAALRLPASRVLIVENIYTCMSMNDHDLPGTVLIWGRGNAVNVAAQLPWLKNLPVTYWGDLDAHGMVILSRLRACLSEVRSVLMDAETLHRFSPLWVEAAAHPADNLTHLNDAEQQLYAELREDKHGVRVRLEQERIAWNWAQQRLMDAFSDDQPRRLG